MEEMHAHVEKIEWACLSSCRPRHAGSNARLGDHGLNIRLPIARITLDDGTTGFGVCHTTREQAEPLLGQPVHRLFDPCRGVADNFRRFEYPLWDLAARRAGVPVYALAASIAGHAPPVPYRAPSYDTSLYFDDLDLKDSVEAAARIAAEAREGYDRGHRAFKIKVGRGARHLPLEDGTRRDIAVVRAVREAVGPGCPLMLDANNGYNLNLAKRVLAETAGGGIFWLEEAFHEDPVLYRDLKAWMAQEGLSVLIADGEGQASPSLLDWAREGLVDVIQYDIYSHGFTRWLETGRTLDGWSVRSAPHHYGSHCGNYAACHLRGAIRNFTYVEWDEASCEVLDASAYHLEEGWVCVPDVPGFGLALDERAFARATAEGGFSV